ncbi:MS Related Protein [Caenorhabditis elegans]|uniref:MS Related Protein n=1 Tax=Caenorhabditis elegans TaxID=6239 RepID=Q9XUZ9_CAEEL|nr:MS Related Protein [Caenorhabditis elegans]CAB04445.2 MS Related Protein [Caenorhabditis elegans]|eukprot:NP_507309.2 Uncharacterized protein CELE_F49H6.12 [Caenorhabditis elegans]
MNSQRGVLFACLLVVVANREATAQPAGSVVAFRTGGSAVGASQSTGQNGGPDVRILSGDRGGSVGERLKTTESPKIATTAEPAAPKSAAGPIVLLTILAVIVANLTGF